MGAGGNSLEVRGQMYLNWIWTQQLKAPRSAPAPPTGDAPDSCEEGHPNWIRFYLQFLEVFFFQCLYVDYICISK